MQLAVDIGFGDVVQVDQRQLPDAAARQRFNCPRADAADADHAHMRFGQALQGVCTVEAGDAAETAEEWSGRAVVIVVFKSNLLDKKADKRHQLHYTAIIVRQLNRKQRCLLR